VTLDDRTGQDRTGQGRAGWRSELKLSAGA
jgi:hypothetical protein